MPGSKVIVVFFHGLWAGGSNWSTLIAPPGADGVEIAAVERTAGPVVVAGHDYAGAVNGSTLGGKLRANRDRPFRRFGGAAGSGRHRPRRPIRLTARPGYKAGRQRLSGRLS
jgi:hypothetical protein